MREKIAQAYVVWVSVITGTVLLTFICGIFGIKSYPVVLNDQKEETRYLTNICYGLIHLDNLETGDVVKFGHSIPTFYCIPVDFLNLDFSPFFAVPPSPDYNLSDNIGRVVAKRGSVIDYKDGTVYVDDEEVLSGIEISNPYGEFPYTLKRGEYLVLPDFSDIPEKALTSRRFHIERIDGKIKKTKYECPTYGVVRLSEIVGKIYEMPES